MSAPKNHKAAIPDAAVAVTIEVLTNPLTCLSVPLKSTVNLSFSIITVTLILIGSSWNPSSSI